MRQNLCKIFIFHNKRGSGFLIKLFKNSEPFYCLMTNEHVITKKCIKDRIKIEVYYNYEDEKIEISLNPEERFIKDFRDYSIDATVIQILPEDNIQNDYFLLPFKDYMDDYERFKDEDITIIQYPKGKMNYSNGQIIGLTGKTKYEFSYNASTDEGSSGSPIILKDTKNVIGIHKEGNIIIKNENENIKVNLGDFIWPIHYYFKNLNDSKNEAEKKGKRKEFINNNNPNLINDINIINNIKEEKIKNNIIHKNNLSSDQLNKMIIIYEVPDKKI